MVCDFEELYRYLIDDFLVGFCGKLKKRDFIVKFESVSRKTKGKREYLNGVTSRELIRELYGLFESMVEIPRIRIGRRQTVETLIDEEALLLAKFLRDEQRAWTPRVAVL